MVSRYDVVRARGLAHDEALTRARQDWVRVPPGFRETLLPTRPGVDAVYREDRPTDALAIRVAGDRIVIHRDRYHPRYHPAKHLLHDRLPAGIATGTRRLATGFGRVAGGLGRLGAALRPSA